MTTVSLLEQRILELEKEVKKLKQCKHEYKRVGGRNRNYVKYFSGCHAYIECVKCGHREVA